MSIDDEINLAIRERDTFAGYAAEAERKLDRLRARKAAERSYGERVAESLIAGHSTSFMRIGRDDSGFVRHVCTQHRGNQLNDMVADVRRTFAAALDAAHAEGAAEMREKAVKVVAEQTPGDMDTLKCALQMIRALK